MLIHTVTNKVLTKVRAFLLYQLLTLRWLLYPWRSWNCCGYRWVVVNLKLWLFVRSCQFPLGWVWSYIAFLQITTVWWKHTYCTLLTIPCCFSLWSAVLLIDDGQVMFINFRFQVLFPVSIRRWEGGRRWECVFGWMEFGWFLGDENGSVFPNFFVHDYFIILATNRKNIFHWIDLTLMIF